MTGFVKRGVTAAFGVCYSSFFTYLCPCGDSNAGIVSRAHAPAWARGGERGNEWKFLDRQYHYSRAYATAWARGGV